VSLRPYLDREALRSAADIALGGLSQWPWSPLFDQPAVLLLCPIGTVRVHGLKPDLRTVLAFER
jgi:hypothetical protein